MPDMEYLSNCLSVDYLSRPRFHIPLYAPVPHPPLRSVPHLLLPLHASSPSMLPAFLQDGLGKHTMRIISRGTILEIRRFIKSFTI